MSANDGEKLTLVEIGTCDEPGLESWSPFCFKAHRALQAAGLRYRRLILKLPNQGKRYNPTGQFPTLLVGDQPVPDSTNILRRVDELSGGKLTAGLSRRAAGEAWVWEEFADSTLNGFLLASRWADPDNWPRSRDAILGVLPPLLRKLLGPRFRADLVKKLVARDIWRAGPEACWQRFGDTLDQLEARAPTGDDGYWMGTPAPTVADLSIHAQLQGIRTRLAPRQRAEIEKRLALARWLDRVQAATSQPQLIAS
jgi:glutathione S-transferase